MASKFVMCVLCKYNDYLFRPSLLVKQSVFTNVLLYVQCPRKRMHAKLAVLRPKVPGQQDAGCVDLSDLILQKVYFGYPIDCKVCGETSQIKLQIKESHAVNGLRLLQILGNKEFKRSKSM